MDALPVMAPQNRFWRGRAPPRVGCLVYSLGAQRCGAKQSE